MRVVKAIFKLIFYFIFAVFFLAGMFLCSVFKDESKIKKLALLLLGTGIVLTAIFLPSVFFILTSIYLISAFVFACMMVASNSDHRESERRKKENESKAEEKAGDKAEDNTGERRDEGHKRNIPPFRRGSISFFEGMTMDEAKKEYRKLMKLYHPDNARGGDPEMSKKIAAAYNEFKKRYG